MQGQKQQSIPEAPKETSAGQRTKAVKRFNPIIIIIIAVVLLAAVTVGLLLRFSANQDEAMYQDRVASLTAVTDKTGEVFSVIETVYMPITDIVEKELQSGHQETHEELVGFLNNLSGPILDDRLYTILIDKKGDYICSDATSGHWTDLSSLLEATESNNVYIGTIPSHGAERQYIFFIRETALTHPALPQPVYYIAVALDAEALIERLEVQSFGDRGFTYIIRNDGRTIFRQRSGNEPLKGYNVLKGLEEATFREGDSVSELAAAIQKGQNTACCFTLNGQEYFVANQSVVTDGWSILVFAESEVLGVGISRIRADTLRYIALVAAVIVTIILLMTFTTVLTVRNRDKKEQQRINALNEQLKLAAEEAQEANRAKTSFLSNMSHDIRTPINGIIGMTAIAAKEKENPERTKDCLRKISQASEHLLSLINDVLDMSRIEQNRTVIAHEPMDLRALTEECGTIIRGQMNGRDIRYYEIWPEGVDGHVLGDQLHLRQIFINILGNAVKFTPDGGSITAEAAEIGESDGKRRFRFTFTDTGIGMKPEFIPKIFEAFAQEDGGSRTKYKGTGLGMAITRQFTELMGGTIHVESELDKGSRFTVEIPFDPDPDAAERTKAAEPGMCSIHGMKIMLVEDNELNMEIATELLTDEGAEVFPMENGKEALEAFRDHAPGTYDIILMDIMMPVMNGYEATQAIRSLPDRTDAKTIPIMAMSANAFEEDVKKSLNMGMNEHLSKPIDLATLLSILSGYR